MATRVVPEQGCLLADRKLHAIDGVHRSFGRGGRAAGAGGDVRTMIAAAASAAIVAVSTTTPHDGRDVIRASLIPFPLPDRSPAVHTMPTRRHR
jgi:hypothetical protein